MRKDVKSLYEELVGAEQRVADLKKLFSEKKIRDFTVTAWRENEDDPEISSADWVENKEQKRIKDFIQQEIIIQEQKCKEIEIKLSGCYK